MLYFLAMPMTQNNTLSDIVSQFLTLNGPSRWLVADYGLQSRDFSTHDHIWYKPEHFIILYVVFGHL